MGWVLAAILMLPPALQAQTASEVRKQAEASMLVTGTVDIQPDGSVSGHVLDALDKLPSYVIDLVRRAVPALRFEPVIVDGQAVVARARMSLRLVARQGDEGSMVVGIRSAHFGEEDLLSSDQVRPLKMSPPRFPAAAYQMGGKGTAYLLIQVGRNGRVMEAVIEQVNLRVVGSEQEMEVIRRQLAEASLRAARGWTFRPPATGDRVDEPYWSVRVPVDYALHGERVEDVPGQWMGYVPGPRQRASWITEDDVSGGPDAVAGGGIYPAHSRFKLLTPLGG
jgi:hypothetical protein